MAPKKSDETVSTEVSEAAAATRAEIGNRPRQSVKRFVEHYIVIKETAPDELDRLFGDQQAALEENVDKVDNPVQAAIEKATTELRDRSIKALENEDELNGYAHYVFDQETFDEKTRVKAPRTRKTVAEKATDLLAEASDEDLAALKELLAARGL
jgi:hypothetical protein